MIRAIFWKELREQRAIATAVLAFGVLVLVLTAQFAQPTGGGSVWSQAGARELMAQALAYLAGTVCGAMLLADEKEIGTLEFLDSLPARRRSLWTGKILFGFVLATFQAVVLATAAIVVGCVDERMSRIEFGSLVVLIGLLAFAWGVFGGSVSRSTLGAVFQGSLASAFTGMVLAVPFVLLFGPRAFGRSFGLPLMSFYVAWLFVGLVASAFVFTALDRDRQSAPVSPGQPIRRRSRLKASGLRALLWLSTRQSIFILLGSLAAGAVLGAIMLAPDAQPVFLWPTATLSLGVLAGVTTLGEEQTRGVARFWAERRLPLGRLWLVKVGYHFGIAMLAAIVLFIPLAAANPSNPFRTRLLSELRVELWRFLFLGLVYGFVVGHVAGMLFRKTVVAGLVAGVMAVTFAGTLIPSVISGGADRWQIWLPAGLLLLTARWLLYPWATDRITARGPLLRAVGGTALALFAVGGGLAYRVYEIPNVSDRLADSGFESTLPRFEDNDSGRQAKAAVTQYRKVAQENSALYPSANGAATGGSASEIQDPLHRIAQTGWDPSAEAIGPWLDRVFAAEWPKQLDELAGKPIGLFDDPRDRDYFSNADALRDLRDMAAALRARSMQRLQAGDPESFVRFLRGGLAAVRSARFKSAREVVRAALDSEVILLNGIGQWLDNGNGQPELMGALLAELVRHEREIPIGNEDSYWGDQIILRNTLDRVGTWLPGRLTRGRPDKVETTQAADTEAELVAFAWSVPWERARRERILRVHTHPEMALPARWLSELHLKSLWRPAQRERLDGRDQAVQAVRRFAILRVSLRLYQLEHGRAAESLDQLVPEYLPAVPGDPYRDGPFRYRVSTGEELKPLSEPNRTLSNEQRVLLAGATFLVDRHSGGTALLQIGHAAMSSMGVGFFNIRILPQGAPPRPIRVARGDAVLWCAGPDGRDDGGRHPVIAGFNATRGEDWIVVVPTVVDRGRDSR